MGNKKRIVISFFLLSIFLLHSGNITLFPHTHVVDGQTITHSHFYVGSCDNPGHNHAATDYPLIETLSMLVAALFLAIPFIRTPQRRQIVFTPYRHFYAPTRTVACRTLRGPPAD